VLIFIGISGQAFNRNVQSSMQVGSSMKIGPYTLVCQNLDSASNANYTAERATIEVFEGKRSLMMLFPERRFYLASEVTQTVVALHSSLAEDLYIVYAGRSPEDNTPVIHAYLNPLVRWIWLGGLVLVLGTVLALVPSRQPQIVLHAERESVPAGAGVPVSVVHGND
ncbi:MAG: cytochrome c-type biogenesis CcmF C-terminal domain-containing protein, partial [Candidatus Acidiferrales bacterium]